MQRSGRVVERHGRLHLQFAARLERNREWQHRQPNSGPRECGLRRPESISEHSDLGVEKAIGRGAARRVSLGHTGGKGTDDSANDPASRGARWSAEGAHRRTRDGARQRCQPAASATDGSAGEPPRHADQRLVLVGVDGGGDPASRLLDG